MSSKPHHRAIPKEVEIQKDPLKWVLRPRALNIAWGNDSRNWEMPKAGEKDPAKLWMVSWFEVTGTIKDTNIVKGKSFEISFKVDMEEAFEWTDLPVFMMAKLGKQGKCKWEKVPLSDGQEEAPVINMLIQVEDDNHEHTLYFGLYEIWSAKCKVGMKIHHVEVTSK
ncbi:protein PHLOEM PROTEIN 2-LIKE A9 [Manihot esculenta]|uniref:Phloem protein 2 n=1 Tax=Manihot esculenta TaxID=3983 RepID=A0A2C9U8Z4_MANES|nr:protein PHLOEM PROTEIN 2-LIKE A9 [Manihot esculenta]OAY26593.1 hypothetical protein MANES_16G059700v8 [Manihot esculenta]